MALVISFGTLIFALCVLALAQRLDRIAASLGRIADALSPQSEDLKS